MVIKAHSDFSKMHERECGNILLDWLLYISRQFWDEMSNEPRNLPPALNPILNLSDNVNKTKGEIKTHL